MIVVTEAPSRPEHDRLCGQCGQRHTKHQMEPVCVTPPAPALTRFTLCGHVAAMIQPEG